MKTFTAELAAHYAGDTSIADCLLVTRADAEQFAFSSHDKPITVGAITYLPGLQISAVAQSAGLATNNLQLTVIYDDTFLKVDFLAGRWANARWEMFQVNWRAPAEGINTIGRYTTGEVTPGQLACTVELRSLTDALQKPVGYQAQRTCAARFADYPQPVPLRRCRLNAAANTLSLIHI